MFLSKLLPLFVYPLGLACVLILLALIVQRKKWRAASLILAISVLWVGGNRWVATSLARSLEWRYLPPKEIPTAEVIVVLSGGTLPAEDPRPIVEVSGAGDRVIYTAWLYQQGTASHILLTGGNLDWSSYAQSPAEDMAEMLTMLGIPPEAIWLETEARNTYENALFSARILKEKNIQCILLVTSASHMPRSVRLFEAQGFEVIPLPTDFTVTQAGWEGLWSGDARKIILDLIPSAGNLSLTTRMLKEYLGILFYNLRGWT
jgi:uncharacterized SAM-binding protein YcdF (DUF218 family)